MSASDYRIYASDKSSLYVVADMLAYGREWPTTIPYNGTTYKFVCNEPMQKWMAGNHSGHAKYVAMR